MARFANLSARGEEPLIKSPGDWRLGGEKVKRKKGKKVILSLLLHIFYLLRKLQLL